MCRRLVTRTQPDIPRVSSHTGRSRKWTTAPCCAGRATRPANRRMPAYFTLFLRVCTHAACTSNAVPTSLWVAKDFREKFRRSVSAKSACLAFRNAAPEQRCLLLNQYLSNNFHWNRREGRIVNNVNGALQANRKRHTTARWPTRPPNHSRWNAPLVSTVVSLNISSLKCSISTRGPCRLTSHPERMRLSPYRVWSRARYWIWSCTRLTRRGEVNRRCWKVSRLKSPKSRLVSCARNIRFFSLRDPYIKRATILKYLKI